MSAADARANWLRAPSRNFLRVSAQLVDRNYRARQDDLKCLRLIDAGLAAGAARHREDHLLEHVLVG
jgi:hypothetical protein